MIILLFYSIVFFFTYIIHISIVNLFIDIIFNKNSFILYLFHGWLLKAHNKAPLIIEIGEYYD